MDTVTIDGVEYVKASVLAKKNRYTSDYLGQLCRGKKVDAHLVGRTWYIYPPSLEGHKSSRYAELRSNEKMTSMRNKIISSRIEVEAPLKKTIARNQQPHFHDRVFWKPTAYESDDAALIPAPGVKSASLTMPVQLAESERVRVAAVSKNVTMVSQPLPAIALSGTLKVQDFTPEFVFEDDAESQKSTVKSSDSGESSGSSAIFEEDVSGAVEAADASRNSAFLRRLDQHRGAAHMPQISRESHQAVASDVRPHAVSQDEQASREQKSSLAVPKRPVAAPEDPRTSLFFKLVIAPAVTLLVAGVAATLLAVENVTVVGGGEQVASLRFDPSLFVNFFTAE